VARELRWLQQRLVARRRDLPDLPAQLPGQQRRRHRRPAGHHARLDHIAALGADGIWISPFFKSPMKDFGYDVSDYCDVDPMFGTLDDFKALVARAHALGLKVMIDQVLSHTSDQHPWFVESRSSRDNPKPTGTSGPTPSRRHPPNNWLSIFGGSAWQWDTRRCQYYLHNFLTSQPDLNFHNPQVQDAAAGHGEVLADLGVDGYRLDTVNFFFHDAQLRDNPGRGAPDPNNPDPAVNPFNPYAWQRHVYDKSRPENLPFLQRLRALLDQYPDTTMVGEIGDDDGLARVAEYTAAATSCTWPTASTCWARRTTRPSCTAFLTASIQRSSATAGPAGPCPTTTWCARPRAGAARARPAPAAPGRAFQASLRGTVCLYQGEELGLPEAELRFEDLQDPYGITMWPQFKGRDGCRTPMPWSADAPQAGFTAGSQPWLPVADSHRALAVDRQQPDPTAAAGVLHRLLHWRRDQPR
jgi:alpha-glucosidase